MQIHNTESSYGIIAKSFHWVVALLIVAAWGIGYYAMEWPQSETNKGLLFMLHKSIGMAVLILAVARLSWRLYDGTPRFAGMNKYLVVAANTTHYLLYVFMFIQPLSGWAMSSAAGYNPTFFGLFTFPGLVAKNPANAMDWMVIHNTCANILLALFVLHVSAALFHHFVLKDKVLRRMTVD